MEYPPTTPANPLPGRVTTPARTRPSQHPLASRDVSVLVHALDDRYMSCADPPPFLEPLLAVVTPDPRRTPGQTSSQPSDTFPRPGTFATPTGFPSHTLPDVRRPQAFAEELLLCDTFARRLQPRNLDAVCDMLHYLHVGLEHTQPLMQTLADDA